MSERTGRTKQKSRSDDSGELKASANSPIDVGPPQGTRLETEQQLRELFGSIQVPHDTLKKKLPEWLTLERLSLELVRSGRFYNYGWSEDASGQRLPLITASFGSEDPEAPVLGLFGGVHGLERIGAQVVLAFMNSFSELILWDRLLQEALKHIRIVFFPMVNPLGIFHKMRSNPRGVDLMRNSPVESEESPTFLVGGHRLSPLLPWYRGDASTPEPESAALIEFCKAEFFRSKRVISLDFHSGFGATDRIWFPFARSRKPFPHLPELHSLKEAFERTHPHHFYQIEPQAKNYTTHGDLWDHTYDLFYAKESNQRAVFLPLAVEMGSWLWVRKNPAQLFYTLGPFNPMKPHRLKRILRRHNTLLDFMIRSLVSPEVWIPSQPDQRAKHLSRAMALWYDDEE